MKEPRPPDSPEILRTKLYPPLITADLVPRADLLRHLEQDQLRPVTLISAPAGYGKSVLASMWLEASGLPAGWVSLDESDNDLHTFVSYLLAAIETAVSHTPLQTRAALQEHPLAQVDTLAYHLLADLDNIKTPFLLFLDDIHYIREQRVFDFLTALIKHPPPTLHLVLVGRHDPSLPIASWRAYQQITEIRTRNLRFSTQETSQYLEGILGREVSEEEAAAWTTKTEGWIVALQLAALSLQERPQMTGWEDVVPSQNRFLHEYLLDEVLTRLPQNQYDSLLRTAILDSFCADLYEACRLDSHDDKSPGMTGEQFIEWLKQSNLFLISLDRENEWFRYHHLFRDYLVRMQEKRWTRQEINTLHLKASRWFAENGLVNRAIRHALMADDPQTALDIFKANRLAAMNREDWRQLEQWVSLFPEEVIQNSPILLLTTAHLPLTYGYELGPLLMQVGQLLAGLPSDSPDLPNLWAELSYFSGLNALMEGPAEAAIDTGKTMLATLPQDAYYLRIQALGVEAFGYQMSGNIQKGVEIFKRAQGASNWPLNIQVKAFVNQTFLYFMEADLTSAQILADKSIRLASKQNLDATTAGYFAGSAYYLQNDLGSAEVLLLPVTEHPARVDPAILTHAACTLMRLYHARRQPEKARAILEQTRSFLEGINNPYSVLLLDMFQIELALDQGDVDQARRLGLTQNLDLQVPGWFWHYYVPLLTPIKLRLAEGKELEQVLASLEETDESLQKINRRIHRIDVLALQALAYKSLDNWPKALEKLEQSITLAVPGKLIRNFINLGPAMRVLLTQLYEQRNPDDTNHIAYIAQILALFSEIETRDAKADSSRFVPTDPLTTRELETLEYLATDLSTSEIAAEMGVTWSTLRTHIKNVYSKLDVHGRYEATLRAKELNLL